MQNWHQILLAIFLLLPRGNVQTRSLFLKDEGVFSNLSARINNLLLQIDNNHTAIQQKSCSNTSYFLSTAELLYDDVFLLLEKIQGKFNNLNEIFQKACPDQLNKDLQPKGAKCGTNGCNRIRSRSYVPHPPFVFIPRPRPPPTRPPPPDCTTIDHHILAGDGKVRIQKVLSCTMGDSEGKKQWIIPLPIEGKIKPTAPPSASNQLPTCTPFEQYILLSSGKVKKVTLLRCTYPNQQSVVMPIPDENVGGGGGWCNAPPGLSCPPYPYPSQPIINNNNNFNIPVRKPWE